MSDRTLVVFVKEPRPGGVKTRLAAAVGPEAAAELYRALAESVLEATTPVPGEYERLVFFDPPEARRALREWLPGVSLRAQARGELGERLADAFARAFGRGATRVAIVGSDAPGLTRETALQALEALTEADVVLGPAEDGGYYLIALRAPHPELVRGIDWSTPAVLRQTLERAAAAGLARAPARAAARRRHARGPAPRVAASRAAPGDAPGAVAAPWRARSRLPG